MKKIFFVIFNFVFILAISISVYAQDIELNLISTEPGEILAINKDNIAIVLGPTRIGPEKDVLIWDIESDITKKVFTLSNINDIATNRVCMNEEGTKAFLYNWSGQYIIDLKSGTYEKYNFSRADNAFFYKNEIYFVEWNKVVDINGKEVKALSHLVGIEYSIKENAINSVERDGFVTQNYDKYVVINNNTINIKETKDGRRIKNITLRKGLEVLNCKFSETEKYFVVACRDSENSCYGLIYNTQNYELIATISSEERTYSSSEISFCNNDKIIVIGDTFVRESDNFSNIYNLSVDGVITSDGNYLVTDDGKVYDALPMTNMIETVKIKPDNIDINLYTTNSCNLTLEATYTNGDIVNIDNSEIEWVVNDFMMGFVEDGVMIVNNTGITALTANYKGLTDSKTVTISNVPIIQSIKIKPDENISVDLLKGNTYSLALEAVYTKGETATIDNSEVEWILVDTSIGSVNNGVITANKEGNTTITARYKGFTDIKNVYVAKTPTVQIIKIKPESINIDLNKINTQNLVLEAIYTNGNIMNVNTSEVEWNLSDTSIGSINNGIITVNNVGNTIITAKYKDLIATANVSVVKTPVNLSISKNGNLVSLKWDSCNNSNTFKGYLVYRSYESNKYGKTPLNDFPLQTAEFIDETYAGDKEAFYVVTALYDSGESDFSNEVKTSSSIFNKNIEIKLQLGNNTIYVNGVEKTLDTAPIVEKGRTLLPIRAVIEALGGTVGWNGDEQKISIFLDGNEVELILNSTEAMVNGKPITLDVPASSIDGRTLVPLRFVGENLGCQMDWDGTTNTVTVKYQN